MLTKASCSRPRTHYRDNRRRHSNIQDRSDKKTHTGKVSVGDSRTRFTAVEAQAFKGARGAIRQETGQPNKYGVVKKAGVRSPTHGAGQSGRTRQSHLLVTRTCFSHAHYRNTPLLQGCNASECFQGDQIRRFQLREHWWTEETARQTLNTASLSKNLRTITLRLPPLALLGGKNPTKLASKRRDKKQLPCRPRRNHPLSSFTRLPA